MIVQTNSIRLAGASQDDVPALPTIWGLDPIALHDHFWAARGVCVVRAGEVTELPPSAEMFLLTDPRTLAVFRLRKVVERLCWVKPAVLFLRLKTKRPNCYREAVLMDGDGRFVRFQRKYDSDSEVQARGGLARDVRVSGPWQSARGRAAAFR